MTCFCFNKMISFSCYMYMYMYRKKEELSADGGGAAAAAAAAACRRWRGNQNFVFIRSLGPPSSLWERRKKILVGESQYLSPYFFGNVSYSFAMKKFCICILLLCCLQTENLTQSRTEQSRNKEKTFYTRIQKIQFFDNHMYIII
jgi:hypothetical protein